MSAPLGDPKPADDDAPASGPAGGSGDADKEPAGTGPGSATGGDPAPESGTAGGGDDLAKVRREAAAYRTKLREEEAQRTALATQVEELKASAGQAAELQKVIDGLNAVLNPKAKEPADPEALSKQIATERAESAKALAQRDEKIRDLTMRAELPSIFSKLGADPELMRDRLDASRALAKIDLDKRSFREDLEQVVADMLEKHPKLKAQAAPSTPPVSKTGTEPTGKANDGDQITREQLAKMKPEQIAKAQAAGRLRNILGG